MRLTYLKSASVVVETASARVICDPWLVNGEYYGAWHHAQSYPFAPATFANLDAIFITHIHPDHCSRKTLALMPRSLPVYILAFHAKFLRRAIEQLGFVVHEIEHGRRTHVVGDLFVTAASADSCDPQLCARFLGCPSHSALVLNANIDSLLLFDDGTHSILNVNDCPFSLAETAVKSLCQPVERVDLLLVGYGGAGPFPQCFETLPPVERDQAAARKQLTFLNQAEAFINAVRPRLYMPFAGTYTLAGRLYDLNPHRGLPSRGEAANFLMLSNRVNHHESSCVFLQTDESIDLSARSHETASSRGTLDEDESVTPSTLEVLRASGFDFDSDPIPSPDELMRLLKEAHKRFESVRSGLGLRTTTDLYIPIAANESARLSLSDGSFSVVSQIRTFNPPFVSLRVEPRLLKRLLMGPAHAHWNNAEIGSHISFGRVGVAYERGLHHCVNFLHV